jgi:hypothetical protein
VGPRESARGGELSPTHQLGEELALSQQVLLADDFFQRSRPHALSERLVDVTFFGAVSKQVHGNLAVGV